jgi:hypothetical protein
VLRRRGKRLFGAAAGQQASVQAPLEHLQARRLERRGAACKGDQGGLFEHRLAGFGPTLAAFEVPSPVPKSRMEEPPI